MAVRRHKSHGIREELPKIVESTFPQSHQGGA